MCVPLALALGCGETAEPTTDAEAVSVVEIERGPRARADLQPRSDSTLTGLARFSVSPEGGVAAAIEVDGLAPGLHGVHLHETGDCSATDASSAGGHWNPTGAAHGAWGDEAFHLGDIGNVEVGPDGGGIVLMHTDRWSLEEGVESSVLGKAVVVHEGADDFDTQPDGAAGARIGCGVVALASGDS